MLHESLLLLSLGLLFEQTSSIGSDLTSPSVGDLSCEGVGESSFSILPFGPLPRFEF